MSAVQRERASRIALAGSLRPEIIASNYKAIAKHARLACCRICPPCGYALAPKGAEHPVTVSVKGFLERVSAAQTEEARVALATLASLSPCDEAG